MCILIAIHNDCGHTTYLTQETSPICHLGLHIPPSRVRRILLSYEVCDECWVLVPESGQLEEVGEREEEVHFSERKIGEIKRWREGVEGEVGDGGSGEFAGEA